ncbi:MAG: TolC family protein [Planctomycetaceae bacterium]|nr:TolC family protein [Planctomycetaceae bacterium]
MSLFRTARACALPAVAVLLLFAGCTSASRPTASLSTAAASPPAGKSSAAERRAVVAAPNSQGRSPSPITTVDYEEPVPVPAADRLLFPLDADDPFAGQSELALEQLVGEVHRRNPTLQAALAAWGAAAERYPQAIALDDPMLQSMLAPGSFPSSSNVQPSYYVGLAQKVPWWGKRDLRGQIAQAQASAAGFDSQEVQLRLTEITRIAYFDYFLVDRELELNRENVAAMQGFRATASTKYELTQVTYQDVIQADVELATLESRQIELNQNERVTLARINTLLHRLPDHSLPRPPAVLLTGDAVPAAEALRQIAIEQRPDLAAQANRIQAEQSSLALACKEFYPDFEFMGRYDQFWTDVEQRPQVGMNVNVPLNQTRRKAAVREAMFRLNRMQAEYQQHVDSIRQDVEMGLARLDGSRRTVALYTDRILPKARENVESATSGYEATTLDFLRLIEAQRELIELQEKHQAAIADYHRRRAELERAVGAPFDSLVQIERL